ncbi:uncharacterized protein TNCV_3228381 [Trichonephila clavipes]|nr:uncharacterized protein TNCV_3228381 [Trichonephila clavipes]
MIRVMAWILRFQPKAKDLRKCAEFKNEEFLNAQKIIFRLIQKECYSNEETRKSLKGLLIFEDEGILRLKSRLINEEESKDFISPIILPSNIWHGPSLELITSLSTTDFIQAMRRFIAKRGRISVMYSDNGTNFTGLNNALRQLDWTTIESEFRVHEIR